MTRCSAGASRRSAGHGVVTTVVNALPSSQTSPASGSLVSGVSSVAFIGHQLYALLSGAGCSHGVPTVPNGVIKVGQHGTWKLIANLSAFQAAHPVANPDPGDFEPDGTWYSMIAIGGALYPMDSNHGELDRVTPAGAISRVIDISASQGHVVPTALVHHRGAIYIANLGLFDPSDRAGDEHVWRLTGHRTLKVRATGVEKVLGLAFRGGQLYALEMSTTAGGPTPGTGAIVRVKPHGPADDGRLGPDVPDRHDSRPRRGVLRLQPGLRLRRRTGPDPPHPTLTSTTGRPRARRRGPPVLIIACEVARIGSPGAASLGTSRRPGDRITGTITHHRRCPADARAPGCRCHKLKQRLDNAAHTRQAVPKARVH